MKEFITVAKAVSDTSRVRALLALSSGELCVCQIIEVLSLAPSTVSKHMAVLYQAGLVETRKEGRWIYYRLADGDASPCVGQALEWIESSLADDSVVRGDAKRLKCIRKMDREELCCHYKPRAL